MTVHHFILFDLKLTDLNEKPLFRDLFYKKIANDRSLFYLFDFKLTDLNEKAHLSGIGY